MKKIASTTMTLLVLGGLVGCGDAGRHSHLEELRQSVLYFYSTYFSKTMLVELSGHGLNGISINGDPLSEHAVVAVSLVDVQMPKGPPQDLNLHATLFKGMKFKGQKAALWQMVGAMFTGLREDGETILLRIDDIQISQIPYDGYLTYLVTYQTQEGWKPLCGLKDDGTPEYAIPLNGVWDYREGMEGGGGHIENESLFTFACAGYTLAKCVELGYPPWVEGKVCETSETKSKKNCVSASLAQHHQACVRALRADYCGDGVSHTVDGILVNLYDGIAIRADLDEWDLEAEWDASGARCVQLGRIPAKPLPQCVVGKALDSCGDPAHFEAGSLLFTEVAPL